MFVVVRAADLDLIWESESGPVSQWIQHPLPDTILCDATRRPTPRDGCVHTFHGQKSCFMPSILFSFRNCWRWWDKSDWRLTWKPRTTTRYHGTRRWPKCWQPSPEPFPNSGGLCHRKQSQKACCPCWANLSRLCAHGGNSGLVERWC